MWILMWILMGIWWEFWWLIEWDGLMTVLTVSHLSRSLALIAFALFATLAYHQTSPTPTLQYSNRGWVWRQWLWLHFICKCFPWIQATLCKSEYCLPSLQTPQGQAAPCFSGLTLPGPWHPVLRTNFACCSLSCLHLLQVNFYLFHNSIFKFLKVERITNIIAYILLHKKMDWVAQL